MPITKEDLFGLNSCLDTEWDLIIIIDCVIMDYFLLKKIGFL